MVLNIVDYLKRAFNEVTKFMDKYYDEPFFWIIIFLVLFITSMYAINQLTEK